MKVGIAGCGAIGSEVALAVSDGRITGFSLGGLYDVDEEQARKLLTRLKKPCPLMDLDTLIKASDFIFEATNKSSMPAIAAKALDSGKDILVMSVGGLVDRPDLLEIAKSKGVNLHLPSGAICGIDGVLAAREAGLDMVQITTTKHPRSLQGSPYLIKNNISLDNLEKPKTLFEGSAREAIAGFPSNVNVSITLSFAGIGIDRTKVRIVADPECRKTRHEVVAEGSFGTIKSVTEGITSQNNPRTSYLAILSAMATLRSIADKVHIGT